MTRICTGAVDPLRPAADARMLDSTSLTFEEVVDTLVKWAKEASA